MIKVGLVDCDTSHVVQFSMRLNHVGIAEDQWVEGAQVVCAYRGTSEITPEETIDEYVEKLQGFGIEMVDAPEDMIGKVDAVCVESQSGYVHLERATPFLKAGIPCFVDKPFACTVEDARAMADVAKANNAALFVSDKAWQSLSAEQKAWVQAAADEISKNEPTAAFKLEHEALAKLQKIGVKIVKDVDKSGFAQISQPIQDKLLYEHDVFVRAGEYVSKKFGHNFIRLSFTVAEEGAKRFREAFPKVMAELNG